jgi:superfamily II DNA/RNA helicase
MQFMAKGTGINIVLGEKDISPKGGHIIVTTPNYVKAKLEDRKKDLDLTKLKMVIYDEADELFLQ